MYFILEYWGVEPKTEAVPLLKPHLYTPAPVPLLILERSVYQTWPHLLFGVNTVWYSHLLGNMTVNGLWYTYFGIILPCCSNI